MARVHDHADPFEIRVDSLAGEWVAVDAYLLLYKALKGKRAPDGGPLRNDAGEPISHIIGAWEQTAWYLEHDITPVYVIEGGIPDLKVEEIASRADRAENATENYEAAQDAGDTEAMQKWGPRADRLSRDNVAEARAVFDAMGVPVFDAPSEADPQCAQLNQEGVVSYVHTEDFDHLLHGANGLLRRFDNGVGQLVSRQQLLDALDYTHDQLVWRQIVAGCDYTTGPDRVAWGRAGSIVDGCESFDEVIEATKDYCSDRDEWQWDPDRWRRAWDWFEDPDVATDVDIESGYLSPRATTDVLVDDYGLDERRVRTRLRDIVEG